MSSVLANFICEACTGDDITVSSHQCITDHVDALHRFSLSNPATRIVVAPPLPRGNPDWFQAYLPGFTSFLYHEVTRMCNLHLKFMTPFVAPPSFFELDQIHLNADAGLAFVQFLVSNSDQLFPPTSEVTPVSVPADASIAVSLTSLSRSVDDLRADVRRRRLQDNLLFARIKEDRDYEINRSRKDRCTISGLNISTPPPSDPRERKEFFKSIIAKLIDEACPDGERPVVIDVLVNMRFGRGPPFFEIKLDSVASSLRFRIAASKLAKDGVGSFSGLFISNTVNLSTRIRIDIMKILSKRLTTGSEVCYVQGFSSRPTLHYRMKEIPVVDGPASVSVPPIAAPGTGRSYTFTEGIGRWGHLLSSGSLEAVRRKAVQAFAGCLEQYFVVLSDRPVPEADDTIFSRIARPSRGRGFPRSQGRRGSSSRRGQGFMPQPPTLTGGNSWARYEVGGSSSSQASASGVPEPLRAKRGPPSESENSTVPTKKRTEDALDA